MKIAICDDQEFYITQIQKLAANYFAANSIPISVQTFSDASLFLQTDLTQYDIVFLDVNMGDYNGIDIAKQMRSQNATAIIVYISAYVEYAIAGYTVQAFQYLLKCDLNETFDGCMDDVMRQLQIQTEVLRVPTRAGEIKTPLREVLYLESKDHKIIVHTQSGAEPVPDFFGKLTDIEAQLMQKGFLRIQKSFLVNMAHIISIKSRVVRLDTGETLNCSKERYNAILKEYLLWEGR